jgi:CheY-like chemotaxis protein
MPTASPTPPETVLVVDDDPEIRQLLFQYLVSAGLRPLGLRAPDLGRCAGGGLCATLELPFA